MLRTLLLGALVSLPSVAFAKGDALGEKGKYLLNRQNSSSLIEAGQLDSEVVTYDNAEGAYGVKLTCDFRIRFRGRLSGTTTETLPETLFDGNLLTILRARGTITTENFTVTHQGFEDVTLQGGSTYHHTDKIHISNVTLGDGENSCMQQALMKVIRGIKPKAVSDDIRDLAITLWVYEDVPAGGIVRGIATGRTSGVSFRIGMDYQRP